MPRIAPFLVLSAALGAALALAELSVPFAQEYVLPSPTSTSSVVAVVPQVTLPSLVIPSLSPATTTSSASATTSTPSPIASSTPTAPKKAVSPAKKPVTQQSVSITTQATSSAPTLTSSVIPVDLEAAAQLVRGALVNIVCYAPAGSRLRSTSGSGIIIDPKGIILTNAHVAQSFLLSEQGVSCTIRAGSPARNAYKAAPIFVSPSWIKANATVLTSASPSGTGEYDYALLAITKSVTSTPLPETFPFIPLAASAPSKLTPVVIASFGAQFLDAGQIISALFPTVVYGSVKEIYTFGTNTVDVFSLGGSAAAQEGSSGGGVANGYGELIGTITTSTIQGATDTRIMSAITASYIRRAYSAESGQSFSELLAQSTTISISSFAPQIPALAALITAHL